MAEQRILIAEDDALIRDVLAEKFEKEGFLVDRAKDGLETEAMLNAQKPDLLVLDIFMPGKDGMEIFEALRKNPEQKDLPVIVISNSSETELMTRARELGAKDFFIKAVFNPSEIIEKAKNVLNSVDTPNNLSAEAQSSSAEVAAAPVSGEAKPSASPSESALVLVVEDDKFLRDLLVKKLSSEKFVVESAADGEEAQAKLKTIAPAIVLLDLMLPRVDGFEVLRGLRAEDATKATPVIIFSNLGDKADIDKAMELGATDFMVKANFTLEEIVQKVTSLLK